MNREAESSSRKNQSRGKVPVGRKNRPLTTPQKRALSMLANKLWEENPELRQREWSGEVSPSQQASAWRKRVIEQAFGITSLTQAVDSHYLAIKGTILDAAGLSAEALQLFRKDSKVKDHGSHQDTPENRGRWVWKIENLLSENALPTEYALKIARDATRNPQLRRLQDLELRQIRNCFFTVNKRCSKKA